MRAAFFRPTLLSTVSLSRLFLLFSCNLPTHFLGSLMLSSLNRLCFRLYCYDVVQSEAILTALRSSVQYQVCVCTKFVEPFQAQLGSLYVALGETEQRDGKCLFVFSLCERRSCLFVCGGVEKGKNHAPVRPLASFALSLHPKQLLY